MSERRAELTRRTTETEIVLRLDLEGTGAVRLDTGIGFLDHMLTQFAVHGLIDVDIEARGDLDVDGHHTVEDVGIALGGALAQALGDRAGIRRYGAGLVPLDEALARVVVDLSGRPGCYGAVPLDGAIGTFDCELVWEFLVGFSRAGALTLHVAVLSGDNRHHIVEAVFKALGRAVDEATTVEARRGAVPSSKGRLT